MQNVDMNKKSKTVMNSEYNGVCYRSSCLKAGLYFITLYIIEIPQTFSFKMQYIPLTHIKDNLLNRTQ